MVACWRVERKVVYNDSLGRGRGPSAMEKNPRT
jgi:hypothetical protein